MIGNLFYSPMSNILSQWSDFRVSRNLYKSYYSLQNNLSKNTQTTQKNTTAKTAEKSTLTKLSDDLNSSAQNLSDVFGGDKDKAFAAAENFVKSYNSLNSCINISGNSGALGKQKFMSNMTDIYSSRLEKAGVSVGADGKLSIDREKFESAGDAELQKIFGGSGSYADFIKNQAAALSRYSTAYSGGSSTYTRTGMTQYGTLTNGNLLNMFF